MYFDVENVFKANTKTTYVLLAHGGNGFYIPAYQREYSWTERNIRRLFEDVCHGFAQMLEQQESITFLGTIILIKDNRHETINPLVKGQVPGGVYLVIDGQQRITTLMLTCAMVHETLRKSIKRLEKKDDDVSNWFRHQSMQMQAKLLSCFEIDMNVGEGLNRWYPKLIRAFVDTWSWTDKANYTSPVAGFLHGLIRDFHGSDNNQIPLQQQSDSFRKARLKISSYVEDVANISPKEKSPLFEYPRCGLLARHLETIALLFGNSDFPDKLVSVLENEDPDHPEQRLQELFRLLTFSRYILDRVAVTQVVATNEDYAFDVFEALNTTGEPLNAIETFKPKVISMEELSEYEASASKKWMDIVDGYLAAAAKVAEKQKLVDRLLIPHRLFEEGEKLSKHLSHQRGYLKKSFSESRTSNEKREFLRSLASMAHFLATTWKAQDKHLPEDFHLPRVPSSDFEVAAICLDVLQNSKHDITIAPIFRFFSMLDGLPQNSAEFEHAAKNTLAAIKAFVAFFMLWRGTRLSTAQIDSRYRMLMKGGLLNKKYEIKPWARKLRPEVLSVTELRETLRLFLEHGDPQIAGRDDWVRLASNTKMYDNISKPLLKLMLLIASNNTVRDKSTLGLVRRGISGVKPTLTWMQWVQWRQDYHIEHIAPQSPRPASGYASKIYDESDIVDRLGNLTLLPGALNASLGNRAWADKQKVYKALSSETPEELDDILEEVGASKTAELAERTGHLAHSLAIGDYDGPEWSYEFMQLRGQRTAELIWDEVAPWLGYENG